MKPVAEQTLYEILEVPCDAPEADIVRAWERAEALYGPGSLSTYTLVSPEEAAAMGAKLEEALNVLLDPAARSRYDARIRTTPAANGVHHDGDATPWPQAAAPTIPPVIPPLVLVSSVEPGGPADAEPSRGEEPRPEAPLAGVAPLAPEPPPIVLSRVVPELQPIPLLTPIPLATPAPISPPFAALLESPAALAVSPLATGPSDPRATPEPPPLAEEEAATFVLPEGAAFTGEVLRQAREARGLGVQQVCERTKIARHHLENLEADRHEKLPAPVYLRGMLMALARELRLDGQKVARSYLEAASDAGGKER